MKCRNCLKEIPDGAKSCQYCEAKQDDTPLTSRREMEEMLDVTDPGLKTHLQILAASSETAEDFANAIMCPSCPACGSGRTETCGKVRGIENDEVGRCKECCALFCAVCGQVFADGKLPDWPSSECPACGSTDTDFPEDRDEPDGFTESIECFACGSRYCFACGAVMPDNDEEGAEEVPAN